jgi:hypothetical protein
MLSHDQSLSGRLINQAHHHHIFFRHFHIELLVLFAHGLWLAIKHFRYEY